MRTLLECLAPGGAAFCIVPTSSVIGRSPVRDDLLREHTLNAVISLPDELFYPVGITTCAALWIAHQRSPRRADEPSRSGERRGLMTADILGP